MKRSIRFWLGVGAALAISVAFAMVFIAYARPMEDRMYDLSIVPKTNITAEKLMAEELGWTVYVQTGEEVRTLNKEPGGFYASLDYPGQTFYFARVMTEELDAPTLQLGAADRNFAVFLDGELIYTDCPNQDNRIGCMEMPMHGGQRSKDVTISLPDDYVGRTLTIAQSTSPYGETPRSATQAIPCGVKLYCSFAYESALIAESFQSASLGAVGYFMGVVVLAMFAVTLARGKGDAGLLFLALGVMLAATSMMYNTSYYVKYFGAPDFVSVPMLFRQLTSVVLLAFLATRTKRFGWVSWVLAGACALSLAVYVLLGNRIAADAGLVYFLVCTLPAPLYTLSLLGALVLACMQRGSRFHRYFALMTAAGVATVLAVVLMLPDRAAYMNSLANMVRNLATKPLNALLSWLMLAAALLVVTAQFVRDEMEKYAEKRLLIQQSEMTRQSYENLRRHNEEVMILRHDMKRHLQYLRSIAADEKTIGYLDTLIGQQEKIRPLVQCGNKALDIILGSRAARAASEGIRMELLRAEAPAALPMEDADLCSMMMNLLDNALRAARESGAETPFIRIDMHIRNDFFVFTCENSASAAMQAEQKKETVPKHGLGLKIVDQIAEKYGVLMNVGQENAVYKVQLAIPADQSAR